jgi:hypothetical protein
MAKELTHILIAQDVIKQMKESGQQRLAQLIQKNLPAYYLGSIIPDALFYDVPPFRLSPHKYMWISRAFHLKEKTKNDQKAVSLFSSIAANPRSWRLKMAFAAGIISHTVVDRVFHELIEYYTTSWGEKGTIALATHREIETLIDMILLRPLKMEPRQINIGGFMPLDERTTSTLFRFYLAHLKNSQAPESTLLSALQRAHNQQRFFLKLFATRPLYYITRLSNKLVAGHLRAWHSLFYPQEIGPHSFPVLVKTRLYSLGEKRSFDRALKACREAALNEAIRHMNIGLKTFA